MLDPLVDVICLFWFILGLIYGQKTRPDCIDHIMVKGYISADETDRHFTFFLKAYYGPGYLFSRVL